ncbi:MAG: taurine ABC transporter substrate-binding protein [Acidobacteriota bacterium]
MQRKFLGRLCAFLVLLAASGPVQADTVTVGYQLIYNPWKVAIANGAFEQATGREINFRRFDSGAKVLTAMASGDVDIALAGSSPIAAGVSRGIDMQLFWIGEDIGAAEALVVRDGSGISDLKGLAGKKLGVPFASTTHYHTLFALEHHGIDPDTVEIINMQPNQIAAAWLRKQIDAAFVWDPALGRIQKTGKALITSGELSALGRPTFDGLVVLREFAESNKTFMRQFVEVLAATDASYRDRPETWTPDSAEVKAIVRTVGGDPKDVPRVLALYNFLPLAEQASATWLGGGTESGAAKALRDTAEFLRQQKKIPELADDYSKFVTSEYVEAALAE